MDTVGQQYMKRYAARRSGRLYPVEFVVRMLLGSYPRLTIDKQSYRGLSILDLGCGDGRNLSLLADLGFQTSAVEIADEICAQVRAFAIEHGLGTEVRTGSNSQIPLPDAAFDYVLCCHSLYYVKAGERFADNLAELARVVRRGGVVIASLPKKYDRYTLQGAEAIGDNHVIVRHDPLGLRNGVVYRVFEDEEEIRRVFGESFSDVQIGWLENDFFGIEEKLWIVKMVRS
jgi:SAM-dependent methyltransferase